MRAGKFILALTAFNLYLVLSNTIYYHSEEQKEATQESIVKAQAHFADEIVTEVAPLDVFHSGEAYHQDYYVNHKEQGYCSFVIRPKLEKLGLNSWSGSGCQNEIDCFDQTFWEQEVFDFGTSPAAAYIGNDKRIQR